MTFDPKNGIFQPSSFFRIFSHRDTIMTKDSTTWTDYKRSFLLEELLEQKKTKGKMNDTGNFKRETWNCVLRSFNDHFKTLWELQTIKTEYTSTKAKFQVFTSMLNLSGQPFTFVEKTAMLEADEDQWNSYIEASIGSKKGIVKNLKEKPYLHVNLIRDLLQGETATGESAVSLSTVV